MHNQIPYLVIPAFKVQQPLGDFYIIKITAADLLSISFSEPMEYKDEFGNVKGSQRPKDIPRLKEIAKYVDSVEMAFPNSIILAANYTATGVVSKDETERWRVEEDKECGIHKLIIPKKAKLAAVIDGQHRLNSFEFVSNLDRINSLQLVCSIYFDLPNSYQAFLFATINSNQKKVDRSLALEQFGFNVDDEPEKAWTPEKFAVFLSRKLNIDKENSPFYQHIKVSPLNPENLFTEGLQSSWAVSTATIVDGITSLVSTNPKRDRIEMQQKSLLSGRKREMLLKFSSDNSPLRQEFIKEQDKTIYDIIVKYFNDLKELLWLKDGDRTYITKTVGVQASFDILKMILRTNKEEKFESINFKKYFETSKTIDFSDKFFQASGIGRSRIKNVIGIAAGLVSKEKIKKRDIPFYEDLISGRNTITDKDLWNWDDEAENAVINTLEKAEWNYGNKSVCLFLDNNYEFPIAFENFEKLFNKLIEIANNAYTTSLPDDIEFAKEQLEKFDVNDLVHSLLSDYEDNFKKLGWK